MKEVIVDHSKQATIDLARSYAERGEADGWFEEFYARVDGDIDKIYWADLEPNPLLLEWIQAHPGPAGAPAIIVGCGLGDDAEALSQHGYQVTAFDISPSAIDMCLRRYPKSAVEYRVADLFDYPVEWRRGFDFVYECNTIQILSDAARTHALEAISELVAPGGEVVISCRSRHEGEGLDAFPVAMDRNEIDGFVRAGLTELHFLAYDDHQNPPVPHFFAVYQRPPKACSDD